MRNHQSHSSESILIPEANDTLANNRNANCGRGRGHGYKNNQSHGGYNKKYQSNHSKWSNSNEKQEKYPQTKSSKDHENVYFRCGVKGHWSHVYHTPKHLVDFYLPSKKAKGKEIETNFMDHENPINVANLYVSDFFKRSEWKN